MSGNNNDNNGRYPSVYEISLGLASCVTIAFIVTLIMGLIIDAIG